MRLFKASRYPFEVLLSGSCHHPDPRPLLRDDRGSEAMWSPSPLHGRSFVLGESADGKSVVGKGNGLSYSTFRFVSTGRGWQDFWGMLGTEHSVRDFLVGEEVRSLGVKTNEMECVLELETGVLSPSGETLRPCVLQYRVECPYRVSDFAFMPPGEFRRQVGRWEALNENGFGRLHLVAAAVLIRNLRVLHDHGVLHNAIHVQNYTWALELLDFEGARTPRHPYGSAEYESFASELMEGEVIQTYEVINYIAWCLGEALDTKTVDGLFKDYGFSLKELVLMRDKRNQKTDESL